jgi:hypothetical protein
MGMIFKTILALCAGFGAMAAAQHLWVSSVTSQIRSEAARTPPLHTQVKAFPKVDPPKLGLTVGPIDTKTGQRLAVEGAARRIDLQIRAAQNAVPLPPRIPNVPGMRR